MISLCTLFDSFYLDKGLVLYSSLEKMTDRFQLFIFCFDDKSYEILNQMELCHAVILHHSVFETEELLEIKKRRSKAEYCWTCTPVIIEYVLGHFPVENCTYLDSDLCFYADPQILFDEIEKEKADVCIVEHRFKDNSYGRKLEARNGKYCVEFNYFARTENAGKVLSDWKAKCIEWCYDIPDTDRMGDQKYLNTWEKDFKGVHVLQHLGGGVAPWNLGQYRLASIQGKDIVLEDKKGEKFPLVFYHFQNIRYLPGRRVNIKSQTGNKELKYAIYIPYLREIEEVRGILKNEYNLNFNMSKIVRSSNPLLGWLQKNFAAFKVQSVSDILDLDKLERYIK